MTTLTKSDKTWLWGATLYAIAVLLLCGYLNAIHPYTVGPVAASEFWMILAWSLLYLPILVLPLVAAPDVIQPWRLTEFGFTLNRRMALLSCAVILFIVVTMWGQPLTWISAVLEAFARTGEEVFFRGFLIVLLTRLCAARRRPQIWAIGLSALLFALMHTQTFRPEFREWYSSAYMPLVYRILERMWNLVLIGVGFAFLYTWTRSILPIALIHSALNARSPLVLPFVLLIYGAFTFWAHKRGERVILSL